MAPVPLLATVATCMSSEHARAQKGRSAVKSQGRCPNHSNHSPISLAYPAAAIFGHAKPPHPNTKQTKPVSRSVRPQHVNNPIRQNTSSSKASSFHLTSPSFRQQNRPFWADNTMISLHKGQGIFFPNPRIHVILISTIIQPDHIPDAHCTTPLAGFLNGEPENRYYMFQCENCHFHLQDDDHRLVRYTSNCQ